MLNAVTALQTNVVATVRRDYADLRPVDTNISEQSQRQSQPLFTFKAADAASTQPNSALHDQVAELIAVAQAAAQASAGIEPKATSQSLYGRVTAIYQQISDYSQPQSQPLINLAV